MTPFRQSVVSSFYYSTPVFTGSMRGLPFRSLLLNNTAQQENPSKYFSLVVGDRTKGIGWKAGWDVVENLM
jgi:hypothetical protein